MRPSAPRLGMLIAVAAVGLCGRGQAQEAGGVNLQKDVTIARIAPLSEELSHRAAALAVEGMLAMKLKRSPRCIVTDREEFEEQAAKAGLPLGGPAELREAMFELHSRYLVTGTLRGQGEQVNIEVSLLYRKLDEATVSTITTFDVGGLTSDLLGLTTSAALSVLREMGVVMGDDVEARVRKAILSENNAALLLYFEGRALLQGTDLIDCDAAEAKFRQAVGLDAKFRHALIGLGDAAFTRAELIAAQGDIDGALAQLANAARRFNEIGEGFKYVDAQVMAADLCEQRGDLNSKTRSILRAVEVLLISRRSHSLVRAEELLSTKIVAEHRDANWSFLYGKIQRSFAQRMPAGGSEADRIALLREASVYYEQAKAQVADDELRTVILIETGDFYRNVGEGAFDNHTERSLDDLLAATTISPDNWEAHYQLGLSYTEAKVFDQAITAFKRSLQYVPQDREMLLSLVLTAMGQAYCLQQSPEQAVVVLEEALEQWPANVNAAVVLVLSYLSLREFEMARTRLREAIDAFPVTPEHLLNLEKIIDEAERKATAADDRPEPHRGNTGERGNFGGGYERLEDVEDERDRGREREGGAGRPE